MCNKCHLTCVEKKTYWSENRIFPELMHISKQKKVYLFIYLFVIYPKLFELFK